nr:hypothetical protein [Tanacetum cinerariifolium]
VGLDSGTMDPLEVARQVAMEVERDVDSLEQSCSTTSDKTTDLKIGQKSQCKPDGQESRSQPPLVKDAKTLVSQVYEVAQESKADTVKGFDLNQEVCSEEVDCNTLKMDRSGITGQRALHHRSLAQDMRTTSI